MGLFYVCCVSSNFLSARSNLPQDCNIAHEAIASGCPDIALVVLRSLEVRNQLEGLVGPSALNHVAKAGHVSHFLSPSKIIYQNDYYQ